MKKNTSAQRRMTCLAGACMAALTLASGCASHGGGGAGLGPQGGGSGGDIVPPPQPIASTTETTPTAKVAAGAGSTVVAAGNAVSEIGKHIQGAPIPLLPTDARQGAGGVVVNAGETVGALGAGVRDGLGQMGSVANPVGITVASTGDVVQKAGDTVTSAGQLVSGLGTERLSPLSPLVTPVGGVVQKVGMAVSHGGAGLGGALSAGPVAQLTEGTSKLIVPLTTRLSETTQAVGAATGVGAPVDGLLSKAGYGVAGSGGLLANSRAPVVSGLGGVVAEAGKTVAAAGVLVHGTGGEGANPLGALLNHLPLAGVDGRQGGPGSCECKPDAPHHGGKADAHPLGILAPVLAPVAALAPGGTKYSTGEIKALPASPLSALGLGGNR